MLLVIGYWLFEKKHHIFLPKIRALCQWCRGRRTRGQMAETDNRGQMTDNRGQMTDDGRRRTRGQMAEDGGLRTKDQRSEVGSQRSEN